MQRNLSSRLGYEFQSRDESKRFWEAVDKLKEKGVGTDKRTSSDVQREVADMMFNEGSSIDDVLEHYGIVMESQTPDLDMETGEIFGFGEENEDEEIEFDEEDWEW